MFVAQTNLGKHLTELPAVLDEGRSRLFIDFRVGGLDGHVIGSLKCVGIRAVVVAVLATNGEVAFQYGITEDKLRGPEIIGAVGIAFNGTVDWDCTDNSSRLRCAAWRLGVVEESVDV